MKKSVINKQSLVQLATACFIVLLLIFLNACDSSEPEKSAVNTPVMDAGFKNYVELGDLPALKERGKLRVLLSDVSIDVPYFPRQGLPIHYESDLLTNFAKEQDLEVEWIYVEKFGDLIPKLLEGKGDIIAANMTITESRKQKVDFTVPVAITREQLIIRSDDNIASLKSLTGRKVALLKSTVYWDTMQEIKKKYPGITLEEVGDDKSVVEILDEVASGKFDTTVADSNIINALLPVQPKLKVALDVSGERPIGWAVRPDASGLKQALNAFLNRNNLTNLQQAIFKGDLSEIKKRGVIRMLTRNNAATYFLWRGELMGFEYELVKKLADRLGVRLEVVVAPSRKALFEWLREGRGDMIAASITIPNKEQLKEQHPGLSFSRSYDKVYEVIVGRSDEDKIKDLSELAGRTFHVRRSSAYWNTLSGMKRDGLKVNVELVPESEETEEIIAKVANGEYDLTISDSHIFNIELTWRDDIKKVYEFPEEVSHAWVVRDSSQALLQEVNKFIRKEYRGLFYNIVSRKYFEKPKTIARRLEQRVDGGNNGKLSPYDEHVKKYSQEYNFDWRLVTAQMYQESRFNPKAKSWAGAKGLMQIMPRTARELGIKNLKDPKQSIEAGIKYLDWLRDRFEDELSVKDRMWFTLAAYNAGPGHVHDARRLARQMGWQSTRWFDNVERAMLLLSKRKYARKARFGYVRGSEPVKYVRNIRDRFQAYVKLTQAK